MIFRASDFRSAPGLILGTFITLAGCANVDDVANKMDPKREQPPQYLILTCEGASVDSCHVGVGGKQDTAKDPAH